MRVNMWCRRFQSYLVIQLLKNPQKVQWRCLVYLGVGVGNTPSDTYWCPTIVLTAPFPVWYAQEVHEKFLCGSTNLRCQSTTTVCKLLKYLNSFVVAKLVEISSMQAWMTSGGHVLVQPKINGIETGFMILDTGRNLRGLILKQNR